MKSVLLASFVLLFGLAARAAPAATSYTDAQLRAQLGADLARHFGADGDLQIDLLREWTPPAQTAAHWELVVSEYPDQLAPNMLVRVQVLGDGTPAADTSLLVHAALWRDVWYTRQPIASGNPFDPTLLTTQRVDVLRERDALPANVGDDGMSFCRDIPTDHLVTWHDLMRRPLVHRGEMVEVVAYEGRLSLTMKAQALENGAKGDLVLVRNMESLKNIPAEVVGEDKVQVHF